MGDLRPGETCGPQLRNGLSAKLCQVGKQGAAPRRRAGSTPGQAAGSGMAKDFFDAVGAH